VGIIRSAVHIFEHFSRKLITAKKVYDELKDNKMLTFCARSIDLNLRLKKYSSCETVQIPTSSNISFKEATERFQETYPKQLASSSKSRETLP
jgi:hypothetical protein